MLSELIQEPPVVVNIKDRLSSIIPKIRELRIHTVPVVNDSSKLVGIVEYRDLLRRKAPLGSRVSSVMLPPHSITPNTNIDTAVKRFYETRLREYPVIDNNGKLIGILTRSRLLTAIKDQLPANIKVEDYMTKPVLTITPSDNVAKARWLMIKHGISRLPVVDGNKLAGIVSLTDLIEKIYYVSMPRRARRGDYSGEEEFLAAPVSSIMTTQVYSISFDKPLTKAVDLMVSKGVTGLVVVDGDGVAGVLSGSDILKAYMDSRKIILPIQARIEINDDAKPLIEKVINNHLEKINKLVNVVDFKVDIRSRDSGKRYEVTVRLKDDKELHTATAEDRDPVSAIREAMDKIMQSIIKGVSKARDTKRRGKTQE
ncbi:CBS domain-containing protein [Caldivirga sp. UBA161]|uniref:CBS domain-containing protein n=1 Tax=Caldivirga sp. UBA161 TaxID=1915569 RepID=UPI0025C203B3|nr:CBS domain-containing protein [Caldivirga sp. UBA161]